MTRKTKDDDEDKKPQKKTKPRQEKVDDDEEDEKPRKKKPAQKKEDDDEEDEDDGEEIEDEEPIEWTPRKRKLHLCGVGLMVMMVAYCILMGYSFLLMLLLDYFAWDISVWLGLNPTKFDDIPTGQAATWLFSFLSAPFMALVQLVLLVGLFFSLAVPPKVEGRGILISGIIFGGLFFLAALLIVLTATTSIIVSDAERAARMIKLMGGGAALCFVISLTSAMAYHSKLLGFLNLKLEASQPLTNSLFYLMFLAAKFVLFVASPYGCHHVHGLIVYVFIIAICAMTGLAIRTLIAQAKLFLKTREVITQYIKGA